MVDKYLKNIKNCLIGFKMVGMYRPKSGQIIYIIYGKTARFISIGLFLLLQVLYFPRVSTIIEFADISSIHLSCISVGLKSTIIIHKFADIEKAIENLKELLIFASKHEISFGYYIDKRMKNIRKLFIMYTGTVAVASVIGSLSGLLNAKEPPYQPQYKLYCPSFFNFEENYLYFVFVELYLFIGPTFAGLTAVTMDFLPVFFYSMGAGLLEELADKVNLIDTKMPSRKKPRDNQQLLKRLQDIENEHDVKITKELYRCIAIHIRIMDFLDKIQIIISPIIFIQFIVSTTVICMTSYTITKFSPFDGAFFRQISYVIPMGLQIFIPCYFGNEIIFASEKFSNDLFHSKWYQGSKKFQVAFKIFITVASQPLIIISGMIFQVTLESFVAVCQLAYNLYAVMQNMN